MTLPCPDWLFLLRVMHTRRNNQRRSAWNVRSQHTHARAQEATHLCDDCTREFRPISGSLYGTDINSCWVGAMPRSLGACSAARPWAGHFLREPGSDTRTSHAHSTHECQCPRGPETAASPGVQRAAGVCGAASGLCVHRSAPTHLDPPTRSPLTWHSLQPVKSPGPNQGKTVKPRTYGGTHGTS